MVEVLKSTRQTVAFNNQPPQTTQQVSNVIDAGTSITSSVASLPASESSANFPVSWSGTDATLGSAISNYTIYVSDNRGPFTPWLTATTQTSVSYPGANGHTYSFFSIATDNVGNQQPQPTGAQTTTTIVDATPPTRPQLGSRQKRWPPTP